MHEAWVQSSVTPTKAVEQGFNLYLLLGPYLDGAPACLNWMHFLYNMIVCGGSIVLPIWSAINKVHNYYLLLDRVGSWKTLRDWAVPKSNLRRMREVHRCALVTQICVINTHPIRKTKIMCMDRSKIIATNFIQLQLLWLRWPYFMYSFYLIKVCFTAFLT